MDGTLTQILATLYQAHSALDQLRAELAQAKQRIAELEADQTTVPKQEAA